MGIEAVVDLRTDVVRRGAPFVGAAALIAGGVYVAVGDPSAPGSVFPTCAFRQMTGLWCPGCGLTRGLHELMHGHAGAAMSYNVFTPLAVLAIAVAWVAWVRYAWRLPALRLPAWSRLATAIIVPALLTIFAVLRNIPVGPLRTLAP